VDLGGVDTELRDGLCADRPGDLLQARGDRVQRAGYAVVVEQVRLDTEDLLDGTLPTRGSASGFSGRTASR
jgi:hypothetical protein